MLQFGLAIKQCHGPGGRQPSLDHLGICQSTVRKAVSLAQLMMVPRPFFSSPLSQSDAAFPI